MISTCEGIRALDLAMQKLGSSSITQQRCFFGGRRTSNMLIGWRFKREVSKAATIHDRSFLLVSLLCLKSFLKLSTSGIECLQAQMS